MPTQHLNTSQTHYIYPIPIIMFNNLHVLLILETFHPLFTLLISICGVALCGCIPAIATNTVNNSRFLLCREHHILWFIYIGVPLRFHVSAKLRF